MIRLTPALKDYIWGGYKLKDLFGRDNGGKRETGFGISFTLSETGTALPINFL